MSIILLVRGAIGLLFGVYLAQASSVSWESFFLLLAQYLVVDGVVAAMIAAMLLSEGMRRRRQRETVLGMVVLIDAAGRSLSGLAIHFWPGIAGFPVTGVVFIAIMAASTAAVGLVEAWLTAREEIAQHGQDHQAPQFMAGPVGLAAILSLGFGAAAIALIGAPAATRLLISGFVAAAGGVAIAMAWSRHRMVQRRARATASGI
jgi:hypothetical protein